MNRNQAVALLMYLQRANGIIPTTGAEWSALSGAIATIEGVANGLVTVEVNSVAPAPDGNPTPPVKD